MFETGPGVPPFCKSKSTACDVLCGGDDDDILVGVLLRAAGGKTFKDLELSMAT